MLIYRRAEYVTTEDKIRALGPGGSLWNVERIVRGRAGVVLVLVQPGRPDEAVEFVLRNDDLVPVDL